MKAALTACLAVAVATAAAPAWAQDTSAPQPRAEFNLALLTRPVVASSGSLPDILPKLSTPLAPSALPVESLPAGVPLRVELDKSYRMRLGTGIQGHLLEPVYLVDHIVLPANSKVFGTITGKQAVSGRVRATAIFNGDLTPLKEAKVTFQELETPDGRHFQIETDATERTSSVVRMADEDAKPHRSFGQRIAAAIRWTKTQTVAAIKTEHKSDKLRQMLYTEIPFHPQEVWAGTQFDAELTHSLELVGQPVQTPVPTADLAGLQLTGTIEARLVSPVDSGTAQAGTPVEAVLTQPLFQHARSGQTPGHGKLLLPEGTRLIGAVVRAKSAGIFGRNGSLRLTFHKVELPAGDERVVHGRLIAAEGEKGSHLQIDDEGGITAGNGASHLFTPIALGSLAAAGNNAGAGLASEALAGNGMDLLTRVVAMALSDGGLVTGIGYYEAGKVIFDQWIGPGHNVVFARNTRVEIELAQR